MVAIPDPALVVLIGPAGAGKSTWARRRYRAQEVVSADQLRSVVGSGEHDLEASGDAFALLDQIVAARLRRGLTTVVDTLGQDAVRRRSSAGTRPAGQPAGRGRAAEHQRGRMPPAQPGPRSARAGRGPGRAATADAPGGRGGRRGRLGCRAGRRHRARHRRRSPGRARAQPGRRRRPVTISDASPLSWGSCCRSPGSPGADDPAAWLASVAGAAAEAGFEGIALMDHLIQIPQVGRAWEPIPEPWVTLGLLAGLTTGLRLGTLVTPVTFRAPGILAKTVATLDALSGGRAFCGIGAGWWDREHAAFGLPFPAAAGAARPAGSGDRDDPRALAAGHQAVPRPAGLAARDDVLSAAGRAGADHRRRVRRTAHAADRGPARRRLQPAIRPRARSTASWPSCARTAGRPAGTRTRSG